MPCLEVVSRTPLAEVTPTLAALVMLPRRERESPARAPPKPARVILITDSITAKISLFGALLGGDDGDGGDVVFVVSVDDCESGAMVVLDVND